MKYNHATTVQLGEPTPGETALMKESQAYARGLRRGQKEAAGEIDRLEKLVAELESRPQPRSERPLDHSGYLKPPIGGW